MRRPVCLIGLAFVVIIRLYLYFVPLPLADLEEIDGSVVLLTGQVDKKEYRISKERKVPVIYLKNVQIVNPQTENMQSYDSEQVFALAQIEGVICYLEDEEEPKMGSYVRMQGKLSIYESATNPGEFDARRYYQILHIQGSLKQAKVLKESTSYSKFREKLLYIKTYFADLIDACYEEKDASIIKAMLLGEKSGLDEETKQLYQLNGIIHILSISGVKTVLRLYTLLYNPHIFGICKG